jgi:hypothetical protein
VGLPDDRPALENAMAASGYRLALGEFSAGLRCQLPNIHGALPPDVVALAHMLTRLPSPQRPRRVLVERTRYGEATATVVERRWASVPVPARVIAVELISASRPRVTRMHVRCLPGSRLSVPLPDSALEPDAVCTVETEGEGAPRVTAGDVLLSSGRAVPVTSLELSLRWPFLNRRRARAHGAFNLLFAPGEPSWWARLRTPEAACLLPSVEAAA